MPRVSVILPTYDRLGYLREAIASVLAQTIEDWELIVVDDGSSDDSCAWVRTLGDTRISLVELPHTGNKAVVRNRGLALATARHVAFLDSDDRWTASKLERQLAFHATFPRYRWSYTLFSFIDGEGQPIEAGRFAPVVAHSGWILERLIAHEARIPLPSVMAERSLLHEAGGFNEAYAYAEDLELWIRLAERGECGVVEERLLDVRKHRRVLTQNPDVSHANVLIFSELERRTSDASVRAMALRRERASAIEASYLLGDACRWAPAWQCIWRAARIFPLAPAVARAALRLAWRALRSLSHPASSAHEA